LKSRRSGFCLSKVGSERSTFRTHVQRQQIGCVSGAGSGMR